MFILSYNMFHYDFTTRLCKPYGCICLAKPTKFARQLGRAISNAHQHSLVFTPTPRININSNEINTSARLVTDYGFRPRGLIWNGNRSITMNQLMHYRNALQSRRNTTLNSFSDANSSIPTQKHQCREN